MAVRRLILNGLTAELRGIPPPSPPTTEGEFYHELEIYRQLLEVRPQETCTPVVEEEDISDDETNIITPDCPKTAPSIPPPPKILLPPEKKHTHSAMYLGSFGVYGKKQSTRVQHVTTQLHLMEVNDTEGVPVLVVIAKSSIEVSCSESKCVLMRLYLRYVTLTTCEKTRALFALVAPSPAASTDSTTTDAPHYCHTFKTSTPKQAEELSLLVGDALRMAFASQLQPSAPLWSSELSNGHREMGVRAPDSLPGLRRFPACLDRAPPKCDLLGATRLVNECSPTSSEESNSPTEVTSYRRLGDRPALMKRFTLGFSGALLQHSDDDATPLVADTPTTPTNVPLCPNGTNGYINQASEQDSRDIIEAQTRESNREHSTTPRRVDNASTSNNHLDVEFNKCNLNSNSNACLTVLNEEGLTNAPWFQAGLSREIAREVLSGSPAGSFVVRASGTAPALALSVRVPSNANRLNVAHYLILHTKSGYRIKGFSKEFRSLSALVTHHSVMPELLPVALRLPRPNRLVRPARFHCGYEPDVE